MTRPPRPRLDLTFLGTGSRQHVFVETGSGEAPWVYKIPAAYGRILPYSVYLQRRAGSSHVSVRHRWLTRLALLLGTGGRVGMFATVFSWRAQRDFRAMLSMKQYATRQGLAGVFLPYRAMSRAEAILRVDGASIAYRGPMLVQRRCRFLGLGDFGNFDWDELIDIQHRLWMKGIALLDKERLGPSNWALLDGHVRLGDTGSLTRNLGKAYAALEPSMVDQRVQVVLKRLENDPTMRARAEEYFRVVRARINQTMLKALWKAELDP